MMLLRHYFLFFFFSSYFSVKKTLALTIEAKRLLMFIFALCQELLRSRGLDRKFNSVDSEISEASTLVSTGGGSEKEGLKGKSPIAHHSIRGALSDSEMDTMVCRF